MRDYPTIDAVMRMAPVIPVLVLDDVGAAEDIARALVDGGLPVIEVTLRTPRALEVIAAMAAVPGALVGAGTAVYRAQFGEAADAGARFIVSPGLTERVADAAHATGLPFLPGVNGAGEIMRGLEMGFDRFKFFPAVPGGGLPKLKALADVFADCRFCPTGGIARDNAADWLAHPAVLCVGGSWIVPRGGADPADIAPRARDAAGLRAARAAVRPS